MRHSTVWAGLALAATIGGGCGPIKYLTTVTFKAERLIAEAETVEAEKYAPYEYWSAVTYLHMAREKVAYADHEVAIKYGERAVNMASKAQSLTEERRKAGEPPPGEEQPPPVVQDEGEEKETTPAVKVVPVEPGN